MRSRLALRTAGWLAGLTAALWMTAGRIRRRGHVRPAQRALLPQRHFFP